MPMNGDCTCKHIMVFCVNYSSYDYLLTFMESVERASAKTKRVTNVCEDSCNALQGRLQCFAGAVAMLCV